VPMTSSGWQALDSTQVAKLFGAVRVHANPSGSSRTRAPAGAPGAATFGERGAEASGETSGYEGTSGGIAGEGCKAAKKMVAPHSDLTCGFPHSAKFVPSRTAADSSLMIDLTRGMSLLDSRLASFFS
jgi:hypothetical protein